jgi:hypothetical protein
VKQFSKIISLTLGFGLLVVVLSSLPSHPATTAADKIDLVRVTNTPLPVTGSVAATINGTPNVNVGNTSANPVPVQAVHSTVVQVTAFLSWAQNCDATLYTVPNGKRLVVEYVSYLGSGDPGVPEALFFLTPNGNNNGAFINVPIKSTGIIGSGGFIASEMVKFYAVGGDLTVQLYTTNSASPSGNITISGYLENALWGRIDNRAAEKTEG